MARELVELNYDLLNMLTTQVDELERQRIAQENRYRRLVKPVDEPDADGVMRGLGLTLASHPRELRRVEIILTGLRELERDATREVEWVMRHSTWGPWLASEASKGVGAKQLARLLGAIGDPYWHVAENRPRRVSELRAYAGWHVVDGVAPKRRRGEQANWNSDARKRIWLITQSIVKSGGPYRKVYDDARLRYADATHNHECKQCGKTLAGTQTIVPALLGTELRDGHKHARALRVVGKMVLRDIWRESRRQHGIFANEDGLDLIVEETV